MEQESRKDKELKAEKFDAKMSTLVKGVAIIFMVVHHLFGFPAWYIKGIDYSNITIFGNTLPQLFLYSVKICINIYAFITGYAYFYNKNKTIKYGMKKCWGLLKRYWFILFAIFVPLIFVANKTNLNSEIVLFNLFALDKRIIAFSWYIYFFIIVMLTIPFIVKMFNGKKVYEVLFPIACFTVLGVWVNYAKTVVPKEYLWILNDISNVLYCYPCVIIGYFIAKYDMFAKIFDKFFKPKYMWQALVVIFIVLICRSNLEKIMDVNLDIIYVPILIYNLIIIFSNIRFRFINKVFEILGKNSLNIWLLHSLIFANVWIGDTFQKIAFLPKNPILVVIWVFILLLPISIILNYFFNIQEKIWKKIKKED